jgi:uncharacterized alpha-E superfamily protein|tara:strand:- start:4862 stop:5779 length:918 start_codon:yes stop_codon:yes gene_type:complete
MERAEMTSRLFDVAYRISITQKNLNQKSEWESILLSTAVKEEYLEKYLKINQRNVFKYLFFEEQNESSIKNCIKFTRENLRMVRNRITAEVWDVINSTYQEMQDLKSSKFKSSELPNLCAWTKQKASMLKGAIVSTQLSNDSYDFMNLGYSIERADNTIRLIDVKNYISHSEEEGVESEFDNFQWAILLRTIAAYSQYRVAYGVNMTPQKIFHFLIFNNTNPRSLLFSLEKICDHLNNLCKFYNKQSRAFSTARRMLANLSDLRVSEIFKPNLNDFLLKSTEEINNLHILMRSSYFDGGYNVSKN